MLIVASFIGVNTCKDVAVELHNPSGLVHKSVGATFKFSNIPPDSYTGKKNGLRKCIGITFSVALVKVAEKSGLCWEQESTEVKLEFKDVDNVVLKHNGFQLSIHSTHAADAVRIDHVRNTMMS